MAYFDYLPKIVYDVRGEKNNTRLDVITNVLIRVRKKLNIVNAAFFEQYFISDGDRADTLAYEMYGDSTLHWVIMYTNYMTNPYYDWPLTYFDLQKFVAKKYPDNTNGVHHYEDEDGFIVDNPKDRPEDAIYPKIITNFLYEEMMNDSKRVINIVRREYIKQILQEFKLLIN